MKTIPFDQLPGTGEVRKVNGADMKRAEYDLWDYRLMAEYRNEAGQLVQVFGVTFEGIRRANDQAKQRIVAARSRRESDEEWSRHIEQMVERTP